MIEIDRGTHRIIDRRGDIADQQPPRPMAISTGLFATPRSTGQFDYYRPRPFPTKSTTKISDYDWKELVAFSRQLVAQMANLAYAITQKNMYAVGDAWKPHYHGINPKWGEPVSEWLCHEWYPNCDVRQGIYDFQTNLFLTGFSLDMDGDDPVAFVEDETGWPRLRFFNPTSVGSRSTERIKGGQFDGARVENGIILDRDDTFLGIYVLADKAEDDVAIPAYSCQLLYEPEYRSMCRGVPRLAKCILDAFDGQDIEQFLKRTVKLHSSQGLIHTTATGEPPPGSDLIVERTGTSDDFSAPNDIRIEKKMGGEILYLQADANEKLESFKSDVPHPNVEMFLKRLERRCMHALGWHLDLADPSEMRGASVRLIQDQARHSIMARQRTLKQRAKRAVQYAVAKAMQRGFIPRNPDGVDALKWGFNHPAQLTVDSGYDEQADQENLQRGITTLAAICEKKGKWWQEVREQRVRENENLLDCAAALMQYTAKLGQQLTFRECIDLMQRDSANPRQPLAPVVEGGEAVPTQRQT